MRSADAVTLFRIALLAAVIYLITVASSAIAILLLIALLFALDWVDGFLAAREGKAPPKYGAYLDIAVDRIIEYAFWLLFTLLQILPWYVIAIIFVRNTIADYLVVGKGKTFGKMRTGFGRIASSHVSRGAYAVLKAVNFAYLALVAVAGWPLTIGYALTAAVVAFSLLRGASEIYEALL